MYVFPPVVCASLQYCCLASAFALIMACFCLQAITQRFEEFAGRSAMVSPLTCNGLHKSKCNIHHPCHCKVFMPSCFCCRSDLLLLLQQSLQLLKKVFLDHGMVATSVCMELLLCCLLLFQPCLLQCPREGWDSNSRKQSSLL